MWARWTSYWFRPASLFNLAMCRIIIVAFQLHILGLTSGFGLFREEHYEYFRKLTAFPDFLYNPLPVLHLLIWPFGWGYRPSFEVLLIIYWITLIAGLLAFFGLKTNSSLFTFAVGNIFLQAYEYSFGDIHHPQALMMITLLILAMSPAGRALSIDDLWRRLRMNSRQGKLQPFNIMEESSAFGRWPLLLIQYMFALIYFDAGVSSKLWNSGFDWMNGFTLQYYLAQDGLRFGSDIAIWLSQHHAMCLILSWITVLFESTFFLVLLFPRLACIYLPLGIAFHTGIYLTLRAPFLQFMIIYSVFIPWNSAFKSLPQRLRFLYCAGKPEVLYDGRRSRSIFLITLLRYFDWFDRFSFADVKTQWSNFAKNRAEMLHGDCPPEMLLILPDGSLRKGFSAFREIARYLPVLWPLWIVFNLPLVSVIGSKIHSLIPERKPRIRIKS